MAKKPAGKSTLSKAKTAVVHAAEKVADGVSHMAGSVKDHVINPVAEAVGLKKRKPAAKKAKKPATKTAAPAASSKKPAANVASKKVTKRKA